MLFRSRGNNIPVLANIDRRQPARIDLHHHFAPPQWMHARAGRPYFLFVNYMDAHAPYLPAPAYRAVFPRAYARQGAARSWPHAGTRAIG